MSKSKLVLLEGIPGSGKTTAGLHLQAFLEQKGLPVTFWREGNFDNPADFEGVARLSESEYQHFLHQYPELAELLRKQLTIKEGDYLLKYRKFQQAYPHEIPQTFVDELSRFDVYDGLPMEEYCRLALDRWQEFVQVAKDSTETTLLECCLLQNPLTVMLARHNADPVVAGLHIEKIVGIIQELHPLLIYLSPVNVRNALEHVRLERPKEWVDFVTWYLTGQAYGKAHHLDGYSGVIQFYEMRQKLELELIDSLPIRSLIIKHAGNKWKHNEQQIAEFIRLNLN